MCNSCTPAIEPRLAGKTLHAMRLVSYGRPGEERPGVQLPNGIVPVASLDPALPTTVKGLIAGEHLSHLATLAASAAPTIPNESVRLGPPLTDPGKIICVGLNYRGHAAEQGKEWPTEPLLFSKPTTALCGPRDAIILPPDDCKPDYEVELVVVIGKGGRHIPAADAFAHVAGYCVGNDVSGRRWQKTDVQYFRAKGCDTFFPCGPALVTADEIPDPTFLHVTTTIGNDVLQDATVADLIHDIPALIAYISRYMTLEPGDLISTGTPAGVGCYQDPPRFLRHGDFVRCAIDTIGELNNPVMAPS